MNEDTARADERLMQLLADRATEGLDASASIELDALLANHPDCRGDELEWAATLIDIAVMPRAVEPLPSRLRTRVMVDAMEHFDVTPAGLTIASETKTPLERSSSRLAWYLAAASILLAIAAWWPAFETKPDSEPRLTQYDRFLREADDVVRGKWSGKVAGYENVTGEFAWSGKRQTGFMRFNDLPPNDPNVSQYQLWIVDPARDKHPIDGGVFDIDAERNVIVPIDAKLTVVQPTVFAVTLEKPGGVVVSQGPLLVVGTIAG
ncbi:MAG TPA: anti-sigma factor [Phycisphaerae bacterium]|nr:anti-sigma factor [Phycisphaerae bacterium]